jgi:ribonucleoside-triphosphate reductase
MVKCDDKCDVFSRVCGYMRPVSSWNDAKQAEFKDRKTFSV